MRLVREILLYVSFGFVQLGIDSCILLFLASSGAPVFHANLASRAFAAMAGYYLNGKFNFAGRERQQLNKTSLWKFWLVWISSTVLSSGAIVIIMKMVGQAAAPTVVLLAAKIGVEAVLVIAMFASLKWWVYAAPVGKRLQA